MDKENVVYVCKGVLFSYKEEGDHVICRKMGGNSDHHVKQNKLDAERQVLRVFSHVESGGKMT